MTLFQKIFKLIFVLILGMGISSCVAKKSGGAAPAAGSDQTAVNRVIGNDGVAADFASNSASLITLSYTDLDSYQASSCSLSRLGNVSESQACSCAAGVCTVGVTSALNYSGAADFYFNVISNGRTSTTGHVTFNITSRPLNTPPVSVNLTPAAFDEDIQSIITLSYSDVENDLASSCSLTNLTNISITRACSCTVGGVCTIGVTGTANYNGAASFNYTVTANASPSNSSSATLSINAINDAPTIPTISTQTTNQNIAKAVSFSIADVDSTVSCTTDITAASSNTTLVPNASIVFSGTAPSCIATITPANNQYGTTNITFTLTDTGTPLPALSTTSMFVFNVTGINTAPVISAIANQTTSEDIATGALAFTISDIDSTVTCADVLGTSANTTLVPSANIVIAGTAPNCTATITPGANQNGVTNLTLTLTDHGMPLPALTATSVFSLTVNAINDIPVISAISAQSTNKNIAKAVTFSISDVDSTVDCSTGMTASSTNVGLVPVVNIVFSGTAPACTATITPVSNQTGTSDITFTVTDTGTPLPALTASSLFTLTVNAVNSPPTISFIANSTTDEDVATAVNFTIDDVDSSPAMTCTSANLAVFSSSDGVLIPGISGSDVAFSGSYPNCTATFTPALNQNGSSNIVIRVTDNGTPTPNQTADSNAFSITVHPINDLPVIAAISAQTTPPDSALPVNFTISDVDSTLSCTSSLTASSNNTTVVPNANIVFSGTVPNCVATITPAAGQMGVADITITLTDSGTPMPAMTATSIFTLTVSGANTAPTISTITAQSTDEDTATSAIAFTIADIDSTVACSDVVGTSANTTLIPNVNIVIAGTAPNCTATITPAANENGSASITLTLTDHGMPLPALSSTSIFTLTVNPINDAPTIAAITAKTTDEDTAIAVNLTVNDIDSTITCGASISMTSTNTVIVPNANVVYSGTVPNCIATITPAADTNFDNGGALPTLTFTVTDNGTPMPALTAAQSFTLTVTPVPDISGSLTVAANLSEVASAYTGHAYARKLNFVNLTVDEAVTTNGLEVCLGTSAGACDVATWVLGTGYVTTGTAPSVALTGTYKLTSGVGGAQAFALTPSCSTTTNYYYSVRVTNAYSKLSNVVSTPAWSFWEPSCLNAGGLTGLTQWLDASELSTITGGAAVSAWADKSTNANNVAQATAGAKPAYSATGSGTLPGITFNGTSTYLKKAGTIMYPQVSGTSIFSVIKATTASARGYIVSEGNIANSALGYYYAPFAHQTSTTYLTAKAGNNAGTTYLNMPITSGAVFNGNLNLGMIEDNYGTSKYFTYANGTLQTPTLGTAYTRGTSTLDTYIIGARNDGTYNTFFNGTMSELIILNGIPSAADRLKLEGYAAHKWGLTARIPGHQYVTTPP